MTTAIDICNQALALLGDTAEITSIDPPDGSPQAGHCDRWYPIALRRLLEEHDWSFALAKIRPSEITSIDTALYGYEHAFALPSDMVRLSSVKDEERGQHVRYALMRTENQYNIFTDEPTPVLTYVKYLDTPQIFPGFFIDALTATLAAYLVGPIHRSDSASATSLNLFKLAEQRTAKAKALDANLTQEQHRRRDPSMIRARRVV